MKTNWFSRLPALGRRLGGKFRRFLLCFFRPGKVQEKIARRDGNCDQCGDCCKIIFSCPFLAEYGSHTSCRIYNTFRPMACQTFPLDNRDLEDVGFNCTYSFPESLKPQGQDVPIVPLWDPWRDPGTQS